MRKSRLVARLDPWLWSLRLAWLVLPVTSGPPLAAALDPWSAPVRATASVGLWAGWAVVVLALLVPRPAGLALVRVVAPAGLAATVAAALSGTGSAPALAVATAAAVVALAPEVGTAFVNGGAYPGERRYLLRPPAPVMVGLVPLAWAVLAAAVTAGPLLLAARQWVAGALAVLAGAPVTVVLSRSLLALTQRWVVFVPAGVVLKDHLALQDPVLFRRAEVAAVGAAPAGTDALDLTGRALGLALEVRLTEAAPLLRASRGPRRAEPVRHDAVLFTPTRPGAVLAEARSRRLGASR
ncbi:MAG: hypothetical protein ACRDZ9_05235 [Acidimicrobiales bacterium]